MLSNILISLGIVLLSFVGVSIIAIMIISIGLNIEKYLEKKKVEMGEELYNLKVSIIKITVIIIVFLIIQTYIVYVTLFN
ncbi:MAG: hypothetical protein L0L52_04725 [Staphylococcus equorum]|nr:hypothetical protein [Staphylococcus equorum]